MKVKIEELKEMIKSDAENFKRRGEKVAENFARNLIEELEEILKK